MGGTRNFSSFSYKEVQLDLWNSLHENVNRSGTNKCCVCEGGIEGEKYVFEGVRNPKNSRQLMIFAISSGGGGASGGQTVPNHRPSNSCVICV